MVRQSHKRLFGLAECAVVGRKYGAVRAIRGVARAQHGVITRAQLLAIGLSADAIERRLRRGQLTAIHRGVYLVGPVAGRWCTEAAAVLACQASAWVSHESAAYMLGLFSDRPDDVHAITSASVRRAGIRVHRNALAPDEVTELDGVPITTASRMIIDLAQRSDIENLLAQTYAKHLTTRARILTLVDRYPKRPASRPYGDSSTPAQRSRAHPRSVTCWR